MAKASHAHAPGSLSTTRGRIRPMRTLWRALVRTVFWSFERGTFPYDVAVAVIVLFVLLSPRSWFNDRPPLAPPVAPAMVELRSTDTQQGVEVYRVDARLLSANDRSPESELEHQLHEVVSKNAERLRTSSGFKIVRIAAIPGAGGNVAFYDVSVKP
jgi:hypothetical protein